MENIIEELVSIENQAHELMAKAIMKQKNLPLSIRAKTDEVKSEIEKEVLQKIKNMYDNAYEESTEKVKQIKDDASKYYADTKLLFDNNSDKWVQEIYDRIVWK